MAGAARSGRKRKVATMEELSGVMGVSRPTLSKYFQDPQSVRVSMRLRIEEGLEVYDYRPNIFAINQNRQSTKTIGIVVPYLSDPFFAEIVRKIERQCIAEGYQPLMFSSHGERELEIDALEALRSLKPAGALIAPLGRRSDLAALQRFADDVRTVVFDNVLDFGDFFIGHDNVQGTRLMVDHLCETGEPPCFLEMPPVNPNARKRRRAYAKAMEARGQEPLIVHIEREGWDFERIGMEEGRRLIAERRLPSSTVFCSNDRIAIGFIAAAYQMGLRVGKGHGCAIRVAGHDNHPWSRFTCPPLTTVSHDYSGIAEQSVSHLFGIIENGSERTERQERLLPGRLIERESA